MHFFDKIKRELTGKNEISGFTKEIKLDNIEIIIENNNNLFVDEENIR